MAYTSVLYVLYASQEFGNLATFIQIYDGFAQKGMQLQWWGNSNPTSCFKKF